MPETLQESSKMFIPETQKAAEKRLSEKKYLKNLLLRQFLHEVDELV